MTATPRRPLTLEEVDARLTPAPIRFDVVLPPMLAGRHEVAVSSFPESMPLRLNTLTRIVLPIEEPVTRTLSHADFSGFLSVDLRSPAEAVPLHDFRSAGIRLEVMADRPRFQLKRSPADGGDTPAPGDVTVTPPSSIAVESATRLATIQTVSRTATYFLPVHPAESNPKPLPSGGVTPDGMAPLTAGVSQTVTYATNTTTVGRSEFGIILTETAEPTEPAAEVNSETGADVAIPSLPNVVNVLSRTVTAPTPLVTAWLPVGSPIAGALATELQSLENAVMTFFADLPDCGADLAEALSLPEDYSWGVAVTLLVVAGAAVIRLDRAPRANVSVTGVDSLFVRREGVTRADRTPA